MGKYIDIHSAIKNLPDHLITPEIYEAAIEEGKIGLLNILPKHYLTDETINKILDKKSYSFNTFELSALPVEARTERVCEIAVDKSCSNYPEVPEDKRSNNMLLQLLILAKRNLHYLPLVPSSSWDENALHKGILSLYSSNRGSSDSWRNGRRSCNRYYSPSNKKEEMRLVQILLAHAPTEVKNNTFYYGLFDSSMDIDDIDFLTPDKLKNSDYYLAMGKKDIQKVPVEKLSYEIIKESLLSDKNSTHLFFDEKTGIKEKVLSVLDDEIADIIVSKSPSYFCKLPDNFYTKERLLLALEHNTNASNTNSIYEDFNTTEFDDDICRAIVTKQQYECPEFAKEIWTADFTDFCIDNAPNCYWIKSMPKELQNQKIIDHVFEKQPGYIKYFQPHLITYQIAVKAYRNEDYKKYVPKHFLEDFKMLTGLPNDFFGGETTYSKLRENKGDYTYCKVGECYLGFFNDSTYRYDKNYRLMMTRRSAFQYHPTIVFSRTIGTFHKTWLEKLVADSDPQFTKPIVGKGLKTKQVNPYINVKLETVIENIKVYAHSFLGETVFYTANIGQWDREAETLDEIKKIIEEEKEELKMAS